MEHAKFWKEFFQMYKDLPALWRVKSTEYSDRVLKAKCYMKLIRKLREIYPDAGREMVVKKINNFRTSYRKELKRMKECKLMGKTYKPTLWYFDCLRFLDDQDEVCGEKLTNEIDHIEEKRQGSRDIVANPLMTTKMLPTKRSAGFEDSEVECSSKPPKRIKLSHHYYKKQSRKPTFVELQEAKVDNEILAKSWALQYKDMKDNQKLIARKLISDILFYGCLGSLNMSHAIDLQEIFLKESTNCAQNFILQRQSPIESNSSYRFAEQELYDHGFNRESPIEFNSSSPAMSPTTNSVGDIQVNDIKFEIP